MVKVDSVLFATDFSDDSKRALPYAKTLAKAFNAKLLLLHVISDPTNRIYGEPHGDYLVMQENARKKSAELMKQYEQDLSDYPNYETIVREGVVLEEILDTANQRKVGTIVVGSHGAGKLRHLLLGDIARKVIAAADCPVYVIRRPKD